MVPAASAGYRCNIHPIVVLNIDDTLRDQGALQGGQL
jgi:hypothetical protein